MTQRKKIIMTALIALAAINMAVGCCVTLKSKPKAPAAAVSTITNQVDPVVVERAWKRALELGGGDPTWPVSTTRIVYVPSTLNLGMGQVYGVTVTEPVFIDGKLTLLETIEIHLSPHQVCHLETVLVHEFLHTIATRRIVSDPKFEEEALDKYPSEEAWVRGVFPVEIPLPLCE